MTFCTQELLPMCRAIPCFPAVTPVKQDSVQQKEHYLALLFSLGKQCDQETRCFPSLCRYICLHKKWPFWSKSKRFGLQRKQKMSHSLKHFTWLLPPPPPPETRRGLSAARGEGGPWHGASGHFLPKSSEIHLP